MHLTDINSYSTHPNSEIETELVKDAIAAMVKHLVDLAPTSPNEYYSISWKDAAGNIEYTALRDTGVPSAGSVVFQDDNGNNISPGDVISVSHSHPGGTMQMSLADANLLAYLLQQHSTGSAAYNQISLYIIDGSKSGGGVVEFKAGDAALTEGVRVNEDLRRLGIF